MWQFFAGIGDQAWKLFRQSYRLDWDTFLDYNLNWLWGSQVPEFDQVARKAIELLSGPVDQVPSEAAIDELIEFSNKIKDEVAASDKFHFRWHGFCRYFNIDMKYDTVKYIGRDTFANRCKACGTWHMLRADWRKCYTCGVTRPAEDCEVSQSVRYVLHFLRPTPINLLTLVLFRSFGNQNLQLKKLARSFVLLMLKLSVAWR